LNEKGAYKTIKSAVDKLRAEACSLGLKATSKGLKDCQVSIEVDGQQTSIILGGKNKVELPDPKKYLKFLGLSALKLKDLQVDITAFNIMYDAIVAVLTYHIVPFLSEEERGEVYQQTGIEQFGAKLNAKTDLVSASVQQTAVAEQLLYKVQIAANSATAENTNDFMQICREGGQRSFLAHKEQVTAQRKLTAKQNKALKDAEDKLKELEASK
jgi:acylphosphatase